MKQKIRYYYNDWRIQELLYAEIGLRLKEARVSKGFTQQEVSDRVQLSRTSITNIENGVQKVLLHTLYELCFVLDIEIHKVIPTNFSKTS